MKHRRLFFLLGLVALTVPAASAQITEFTIPTANSSPLFITSGPDGNLWFTEFNGGNVASITPAGAITEFPILTPGGGPNGITSGPLFRLWFTELTGNQIGSIIPGGAVGENGISPAAAPYAIAAGPDGNLWFTEFNLNSIWVFSPLGGFLNSFPIPTANARALAITAGPDGNLWFTESVGNNIGRITPAGAITEFPVPTANAVPLGITVGADGNLWFVEFATSVIARITPAGMITEFPPILAPGQPAPGLTGITAGIDGRLWFTGTDNSSVGAFFANSSSAFEFFMEETPTPNSVPFGITSGPDGNIWFTELSANKIARFGLSNPLTSGSACNGTFNGTFTGSLAVANGQNCVLLGGGVTGNINVTGGKLSLTNVTVGGNVEVQGNSSVSTGANVVIQGNLAIENVGAKAAPSLVCGATIDGNMFVANNQTEVEIGGLQADDIQSCPGSMIKGNLEVLDNKGETTIIVTTVQRNVLVENNTGTTVVNFNLINGSLNCLGNTQLTGELNTVSSPPKGQCAGF